MYKFGIHEYLIKKDKIKLIADYIDEHMGVDFVVREDSIVMVDIKEENDTALREYISEHNAWREDES